MNKILATFCVTLVVNIAFSQDELPDVIPASPEAAEFQKYGEFPVDYSTGVPDISIPIYNIQSGQLSMPMSISYHASGIKVDDISSVVGLGWNLNVGGMVSRTILDYPDESNKKNNYKTQEQKEEAIEDAAGDLQTKVAIGDKVRDDFFGENISPYPRDSYSDRYFYQLPGGSSGIFRYNYSVGEGGNDTNKEVITLPHRNYIIDQLRTEEVHPEILGFHITDDNGTKYYFENEECRSYRENGKFYPTTWHISRIISADNVDTIRFTYTKFNNEYRKLVKAERFSINVKSNCGLGNWSPSWSYNRVLCAPLIKTITARNAIVKFHYTGDRKDVNSGNYRLSRISVLDRFSKERKHVYTFNQSYFGEESDNNQRMRLDEIIINDGSLNEAKYSFVYDSRTLPADLENWGYDHWGFYNNRINDHRAVKKLLHGPYLDDDRIEDIYMGNRHPSGDAKQCMLEEIHYPTGGKTVFTFERHKLSGYVYDYGNQPDVVDYGGLRIKSIKNYTNDETLASERTYQYSAPKFQLIHDGLYQYQIIKQADQDNCSPHEMQITNSSTFIPLAPVKYGRVTEILGSEEDNIGKIEYSYNIPDPNFHRDNVEYEFTPRFSHIYHNDYGMRNPVLRFKREYNDEYNPIRTTEYQYTKHRTGPEYEYHTGVHIVNLVDWSDKPELYKNLDCGNPPSKCFIDYFLEEHEYHDTKAYDEHNLLKAEIVTDHISGLKTETFYSYDNVMHVLPTKKIIKNSKGLERTIDYTYVADKSGGIFDEMKSKNILNPVVKKVSHNNDQHLETITTNFENIEGYPIPKPVNVEIEKGNDLSSDTRRILYHEYDNKGNILEVSREDDMHICYVWGYHQSLPVAKVENATYDEIEAILDVSSIQNLDGQALRDALRPLRTSLSNALVTTFTYDPLIGVVSQMDPNGKLITYDYNDATQLEQIKDNGSIVKQFFYQYSPRN